MTRKPRPQPGPTDETIYEYIGVALDNAAPFGGATQQQILEAIRIRFCIDIPKARLGHALLCMTMFRRVEQVPGREWPTYCRPLNETGRKGAA